MTSGWRNPEINEYVGGVRLSSHQFGNAVDLKFESGAPQNTGLTTTELWNIIQQSGAAVAMQSFCEIGPTSMSCNDPGVDHVHVGL